MAEIGSTTSTYTLRHPNAGLAPALIATRNPEDNTWRLESPGLTQTGVTFSSKGEHNTRHVQVDNPSGLSAKVCIPSEAGSVSVMPDTRFLPGFRAPQTELKLNAPMTRSGGEHLVIEGSPATLEFGCDVEKFKKSLNTPAGAPIPG